MMLGAYNEVIRCSHNKYEVLGHGGDLMFTAEPGDILLYRRLQTTEVREIDFIERLSDGSQPYYYYHCAIALDANMQIESNGKTVVTQLIVDEGFDAFRPPVRTEERNSALELLQRFVGQKYDWILIADDILRAFTHHLIHLPVSLVTSEERHRKICSSLVVRYLNAAGCKTNLNQNALPEDIYFTVKDYQVHAG